MNALSIFSPLLTPIGSTPKTFSILCFYGYCWLPRRRIAGARAAQKIAEKARNKEELLKEIRNTNAATMIAFSITFTRGFS